MPRVRQRFSLYRRRRASGPSVYYFQTYDKEGRRLPGRSTGKTSKGEALDYVLELAKQGRLASPDSPTLSAWVAERNWYDWPRAEAEPRCLYSKAKLARSPSDRPAISRGHVDRCRRFLEIYILPEFGKERLDALKPGDLEAWMFSLRDKGLATKSVVNIASAFRTITAEALRLELIGSDPWTKVPAFQAGSARRSALSYEEALKLLSPATWAEVWKGNRLNYLVNLTAAVTACRQGELLALLRENLHRDHIEVEASWSIRYHERGPTKTKRKAPVPIPLGLFTLLSEFAPWEGYLFSFTAGMTPATGARVADALYSAMERALGIDEDERKRRGLTFHSWRRWSNSYLRARGIPDAKIRELTRHASERMTEHYTSWDPEAFRDVADEQTLLLGEIEGKERAALPAP